MEDSTRAVEQLAKLQTTNKQAVPFEETYQRPALSVQRRGYR